MKENTPITSLESLKLSDFYVKIENGQLIISHIDNKASFSYNKESLVVSNSNNTDKTLTITNKDIKIDEDGVIIGMEGNILDFIRWDNKKFILGDGVITIDEYRNFYFNGIITERNLSNELLNIIKYNKGEQGPKGEQGKDGLPGRDGVDTSRYTYILYSKIDPNEDINSDISGDAIKLGISRYPTKDTAYMGVRYNMIYEQPSSFDNEEFTEYEWMRYRGENAYSVNIKGSNIFKIPKNSNGLNAHPNIITLEGEFSFPNVSEYYWEIYNNSTNSYEKIPNSENKKVFDIKFSDYIDYYKEYDTIDILFTVIPEDVLNQDMVRDMISIYAIKEGDDSINLILSNQMHTLQTDSDNNVYPSEYNNAFTYISLYQGDEQRKLSLSDLSVRSLSNKTKWGLVENGDNSIKLSITELVVNSDIIEISHIPSNLVSQFSLYKAGDGKVRLVRINGNVSAWREGEEFLPSTITLHSRGEGGVMFDRWEYKKPQFNDFVILTESNTADVTLNTFEVLYDCNQVDFKAVYKDQISKIEVFDIHTINVLDGSYNLTISNSQDKVALDTYNNYIYEDIITDISVYQGNTLVPINVLDSISVRSYSGGIRNMIGDIAIQTKNQSTRYRLESLTNENYGKVRFILEYCDANEFITITHIETGQSKVFTIIMDGKYNTSVEIVSEQIFYYDKDGICKPQSITLNSTSVHIPQDETIQWFYLDTNSEWVELEGVNDSYYTIYPDESRWLGYSEDVAKFKVKYGSDEANQDTLSVFKLKHGTDSKLLILSNEAQSILTDEYGNIPKSNGNMSQYVYTNIDMYSGDNHLDSTIEDYSESIFVDCVGRFEQVNGNNKTVKLVITDLMADYGNVGISRNINGVKYTKTLFIFKSKQGKQGNAGDWVTYIFYNSTDKPQQPIGDSGLPPIPSESGWLDSPIGGGVWWMSKAKVSGANNLTISPFSEPILVTGRDGMDGVGSYILDLDNQNVSVFCDKNGDIIGDFPSCKATLYFGTQEAENVEYSIYPNMSGVNIDKNSGVLTIYSLEKDYTEIPVRADAGAFTSTHYMTITKVQQGKNAVIVSLVPSANVVSRDTESNFNPPNIGCDIILNNSEEIININNSLDFDTYQDYLNGYVLEKSINGGEFSECALSGDYNGMYDIGLNDNKISYRLVRDNVVVDLEDIIVLQETTNFMYHYMLGDKNSAPNENDKKWSTVIPALLPNTYLWMRASKIVQGGMEILGITRISGEDGVSNYTHMKYCNIIGGEFVSATDAKYMGVCVSNSDIASDNYQDYKWSQIKGGIGPQGIQGTSKYFHIKYSIHSDGRVMQDTVAKYIGTLVTESQIPSSVYTDYTWSQFEGDKGESIKGDDGVSYYLFIKYSNNGGISFTDSMGVVPGSYMGTYISNTNTASTKPSDYNWVKVKGDNGDRGPLPYIKVWNPYDTFKKTTDYEDIVVYRHGDGDSLYYKLNVNSSTGDIPYDNIDIWQEVESFKIVATDTLLANKANLANFIFSDGVLISQATFTPENGVEEPIIVLDGKSGIFKANNAEIRGDIVATSGLISGELKIGDNTGIIKVDKGRFPSIQNEPVFYTGKRTDETPFTIDDAINIACLKKTSNYDSFFIIDNLGDLYGRNANFEGYVSANRLDIDGRIRQRFKTYAWMKPESTQTVLKVFDNPIYVRIIALETSDENLKKILISEPNIDDDVLLNLVEGTESTVIIHNGSNTTLKLYGAIDNSISNTCPVINSDGTIITLPSKTITTLKLIYCRFTSQGSNSGWTPISIYHTKMLT